ncbi:phage tail protein [Xanthomonas translucens]|uniref:phage tail protein n=1 Tax=Xanthomonas campestris pv. translucens TaxID=343 RepID=UPI001F2D2DC5|nr:phage tail protein [Xanthomonas translucens]UII65659.1 phage tail protein [Xanthomonas translucens]
MRKPDALRAHLVAAMPELARDADRLLIFVDAGSMLATFAPALSFQYSYTLNVIVTDMADDPDRLMFHVSEWIRAEQPELMANATRRDEVRFEVDVLANDKFDVSLKLPVTERVIVTKRDDGSVQFDNPPEPQIPADWIPSGG